MFPPNALIALAAAYLLGCFLTGYYLVRWRTGQDIRALGSGSAGGSNVGRVLGKPGFALTMAGDLLKGSAALLLVWVSGVGGWIPALAVAAVVAGHIFPVQLGFRGGKGLATALGALLVLDYRLIGLILAATLLLGGLSRRFTLSLMLVVAATPLLAFALGHSVPVVLALALTAGLILYANRANTADAFRALRGEKPRRL